MKIDNFEQFNESKKDYNDIIKQLITDIKKESNINSVEKKNEYEYEYNLDGFRIFSSLDFMIGSPRPEFFLYIDGESIKCSYFLKYRVYYLLRKIWKQKDKDKDKEKVMNMKKNLSEIGRKTKKYNI